MNICPSPLWGLWLGICLAGCAPDLQVGGQGDEGGAGVDSSTSSGGAIKPEDCNDGIDNDGDVLVDCADQSDCKNMFTCEANPPAGWTYVHIRRPSYGTAPEPCPDGSNPQRFYVEPTKPDCAPCSCQVSGNCSNSITCFAASGCSSISATRTYAAEVACVSIMNPLTLQSCKVDGTGMVPANAACTETGGMVMNPEPFGKEIHTCLAAQNASGCQGSTCVARVQSPYENKLCVAKTGIATCPSDFSELHTAFGSFMDTRSCSSCACDAAQITCSGAASFALWSDGLCTQGLTTAAADGSCVALAANPTHITVTNLPNLSLPKAACTGGASAGSVVGTEPTTICCTKL